MLDIEVRTPGCLVPHPLLVDGVIGSPLQDHPINLLQLSLGAISSVNTRNYNLGLYNSRCLPLTTAYKLTIPSCCLFNPAKLICIKSDTKVSRSPLGFGNPWGQSGNEERKDTIRQLVPTWSELLTMFGKTGFIVRGVKKNGSLLSSGRGRFICPLLGEEVD